MEQVFLYNKILSHCTSEFSPIILGGLKIQPVVLHFTKENEKEVVPIHQHRFAELSWMSDGSMGYKFGDALQILSTEKKNLIFIPPKTIHQRIAQEDYSNILGFLLDLVPQNKNGEKFYEKIAEFLAENNYIFDNIAFINEFEARILEQLDSKNGIVIGQINLYIHEFLFKLFSYYFAADLIHNSNEHKIFYDQDDVVVTTKQIIEDQLSSAISQKAIARGFNISVRHLNRIFSGQTGFSVGSYIIQRRLNAAQKMLYNPKFSVKEIADSLGFRSDNYFCAFFKRQTGMTPLEYAKSASKD
jgi:AraC-like DNA-binding protein